MPNDAGNGNTVQQFNIEPIGAERRARVIIPSTVAPVGSADANISRPSFMTLSINQLNHTQDPVYVDLDLLYFVNETDVAQAGANHRVVIDFGSLQSAVAPLSRIDVSFETTSLPTTIYTSELAGIIPADHPFSLDFPFTSFASRGGVAAQSDFARLRN